MELVSLLLAALLVAPPPAAEPDPEPAPAGGQGVYVDADPLPVGAIARYGTLRYRGGFPGDVAFSRDGKTIISAGAGNNLHFWETDTGKLVREYEAFTLYNHRFAVSPDGKQVVTGNYKDKELILREFDTGKVIRRLTGSLNDVGAIRFSPDGKLVAACDTHAGAAVVWDGATGKELARLQMSKFGRPWQQAAYTLAFSRDGKYLAVADREVMVFAVAGWKHVATLEGHSDHVHSIAFTPDNTRVITGAVDWTLRVWDLSARRELRRVTNDVSGGVAVTRDGKTAFGNDKLGRLTAWDLESGRINYRSPTKAHANGLTLSEDETRVAGWTWSAVLVYDARTGKCLTPLPVPNYPTRMLAFSPNGKFLALAYWVGPGVQDIRLWKFQTGEVFRQPESPLKYVWGVRVDERRDVLLFGSSQEQGFELRNLTAKKKTVAKNGGYSSEAAFAKDGSVYAAGKELVEWEPTANRMGLRIALPMDSQHPTLLLSADERVLLTWRYGVARSWSAVTGKQLSTFALHRHAYVLALSPEGKQFVSGGEGSACLRDTHDGTVVHDFGRKEVAAAAFSPDGRLIAVADGPGAFQLWDTKARKKLLRTEGHREMVVKLLFSPDSRYLASVSNDTTILVWDVRKLAPGGK